jgi:hypothetical protein
LKIIVYENARVTKLFPLEEAVPLSGGDTREILSKIKNRYDFARATDPATTTREDIAKNGYRFESGRFAFHDEWVNATDLAVYSDGIVANASRTEHAEYLIDDLISFARMTFGFRELITEPSSYYLSQLVVEFDKPLAKLISNFESISAAITAEATSIYKIQQPAGFARIDFEIDKASLTKGINIPRFIIERRTNIPFDKERYHSGAPMKTDRHIHILEEIEKMLP